MTIINPNDVMAPQGGYAQGVDAGAMVFVAGQVGVDKDGQPVGPDPADARQRGRGAP